MEVKAYEYAMFENGASPRMLKTDSPSTSGQYRRPGKMNLEVSGEMTMPASKTFSRTPAEISSPSREGRLGELQNNMLFPAQQSGEAHLTTDSDQPNS